MTPLAPAASPGRRRRLLWLLGLVALLPAGAGGQCGALPTLSSAIASGTDRTEGFPINTTVTYRCREGFVKIPGKSDTVVCLSSSQWSNIEEFCGRGCLEPPRLKSAVLTETDASKSYYPVGINVSYVCRPAYESTELTPVITCLENLTWSEAPEFCLGKSCNVPKGPEHGRPDDTTNHRFGAKVYILCDDGYRIIGDPFIWCLFIRNQVEWSKFPTCQLITCSPPPNITNGMHSGSSVENFDYNSSVTYKCNHNFLLTGEASIHCTTKDKTHGVWNGSAPECKVINTQDKPTTVPAGGADGGGNASVINTQDKPTTVPPGGADGGGNASGPGIGIGTCIGIGIAILFVVFGLPVFAVLKKINRSSIIKPEAPLSKKI